MEGPDGEHNLRLSLRKTGGEAIASASFNKLVERLTTSSSEHGERNFPHLQECPLHEIVDGQGKGGVKREV